VCVVRSSLSCGPDGDDHLYFDFAQAEVMAESKIVRRSDGSPYPLDTPVGDLGKLGVGVGLYFNFVVSQVPYSAFQDGDTSQMVSRSPQC
jgi:hypothetical protein